MYVVIESILFVLTEGCSWRAIDRPQGRLFVDALAGEPDLAGNAHHHVADGTKGSRLAGAIRADQICPALTSNETLSRARIPPKRTDNPLMLSSGRPPSADTAVFGISAASDSSVHRHAANRCGTCFWLT
jgi:hypothetical protein